MLADGQVRYYQWIDTPIFDANNQLLEFQSVGIDITERRQTEELGYAQRDLARIIGTTTLSEEAWPQCLAIALHITGMDSGGIYLFDHDYRELRLVTHHGLSADFIRWSSRYPVDTPNVRMILAGTPFYFGAGDRQVQALPQSEGLRVLALVPIAYQGRVVGCINVASHTLHQIAAFRRHALETISSEIGNIAVYLRTEESLRAEQLRFAKVAATIPGAICTFLLRSDGTLCIPYASRMFEELYGLTLADVSENIDALSARVPPHQVAQMVEAVGESVRTLQPWRYKYQYRHPLKGEIWLEGYSMPIREPDGSRIWHGVTIDVTGRKQAERALLDLNQTLEQRVHQRTAEVQDLYENAPVGYHALDANGIVLMVNQTQLSWLGYTREEILGRPATFFITPESIEGFVGQFQILKERGSVSRASGRRRPLHGRSRASPCPASARPSRPAARPVRHPAARQAASPAVRGPPPAPASRAACPGRGCLRRQSRGSPRQSRSARHPHE